MAGTRTDRLRIAVLASGGGRSIENLVERARDGRLRADVVLVIANTPRAIALDRARRLGIESAVIRPRDFPDDVSFGYAIAERIAESEVDLVVLAGYLVRLPIVPALAGRVINIHPALLPMFGGKGFFGHYVHEAVVRSGAKVTGCTVHFVDDEYDHGPIVLQRTVPVRFEDDSKTVAGRVFEAEKEALPEAINLIAAGRVEVVGSRVRVTE